MAEEDNCVVVTFQSQSFCIKIVYFTVYPTYTCFIRKKKHIHFTFTLTKYGTFKFFTRANTSYYKINIQHLNPSSLEKVMSPFFGYNSGGVSD